ncbi:MAG TPA: amino acid adenylation domain-containing protein [Luteolibacter sp.]|nr:amino acid adenylation domain-containing protein [Luteolibacter sp.]
MQDSLSATVEPDEALAFPASVAQQAFWYLELLDKNVSAFNVPLRYRIDGPLDPSVLGKAIDAIAERHEILRTHFEEENGDLLQVVTRPKTSPLPIHDLSHLSADKIDGEADRLGREEANRCFTLSEGPLFRAELVRISPAKHHLHLTFHHAIFDGLSIGVFIHELAALHAALSEGKNHPLPPLPIQYGDYSVWQKEFLNDGAVGSHLAWWKENLAGLTEPDFPTDHPRPPRKSWKGGVTTQPVADELIARLRSVANANGASLFHLQLAAFKLLVQRYTGSDEISVGTPVSGRTKPEMEPLIGVFINSLIIRSNLSGDPSFDDLVKLIRDNALRAIEHQDLPFENLVRELKPERDPGRNPLFQINFSQDRFAPRPTPSGPVTITPISSRSPGCIFDLHFFLSERDGAWKAGCDYSADLFDRETADRILSHYLHLLQQIAADPSKPISRYELLTPTEQDQLTRDWSGGISSYPNNVSIGSLFLETAASNPDRTAIIHGGEKITYARLAADARSLASDLIAAGTKPGDLVALNGTSSPELIIGILAILLAGGAYVPVHPGDPVERKKQLLDECGAKILVSSEGGIEGFQGTVISTSGRNGNDESLPATDPSAPAYVMFTSGSTGIPKGVVVPHRAVIRLVKKNAFLDITPDDVFLQAAPLSFDASTLEIWGALLNGGSLVIPEGGTSLERIASAVRDQGVTTLWLTSGLFNVMIDEHAESLKSLRHLLAGGDVLSIPHVTKALAALPETKLINGYGPTENTTFTTCHTISPDDVKRTSIPIGKPISNTTAYLLDANGRPVPVGVPGELHTGGDGLAIGYLNDTSLTAAKFIAHPRFGRLYRTGDLCRWTPDGTIEFIGRSDHQVKVRGFRIEPGEIESVLRSHPSVREAKVAVRGADAGNKRILAWVRPEDGKTVPLPELEDFLSRQLPPFMCPDAIGCVDSFPINANGKIDVKSLPDPAAAVSGKTREAPVGETEQRLAALWCSLLGIDEVSRNDEFFDLGGHSLMALRMFSRINREFDRSLPLSALISHPTIAELALLLKPNPPAVEIISLPSGKGRLVGLSSSGSQPPLFCIHGGDGGILFYRDMAARLPADIPVHAVESVELDSSEAIVPSSVEETATSYVETLLAVHPEGPFRLAGYSFGGVVAHEMARILTTKGHRVDFLGLLDTHNPAAPFHVNTFPERVKMFWRNHSDLPLFPRFTKLLARFADGIATHQRVKKELKAAASDGPAEAHGDLRRVQIRQENWRAMQAYKPLPFPGKITLFKAKEQNDNIEWPEDYGWKDLGSGGFEIVPVSGKHLTLFEPENVDHLVEAITPALLGRSR